MLRPRNNRKETEEVRPASAGPSSILQSISRFWLSLLVIGLLLYGALLAIGRTDGFRNLVEQKVEGMTGLKVSIGRAYVGFDLQVRINNLHGLLVGTNEVEALDIEKLTVRPVFTELLRESAWPFRTLTAENAVARFYGGGNPWAPMPQIADAIAPWMNVPAGSNAVADAHTALLDALMARDNRITLLNARVVFVDERDPGVPVALADGISVESVRLQPFAEPVLWTKMKIQSMQNNGAEWMSGLELEWIRQRDQDVILRIEKSPAADAAALPPAP